MATSKTTKEAAATKQFPAKAGHPDVEVQERSTDGSEGTRHVKEFVLLARDYYDVPAVHEANSTAVANEAIQRGLHPRGDVRFDGVEDHPDGHSVVLTYSVDTVPSSIDHTPGDTTTPRDVIEAG
ncbi:hypothetical protein OG900_33430 [Streptomyces sp. NBC_00433]